MSSKRCLLICIGFACLWLTGCGPATEPTLDASQTPAPPTTTSTPTIVWFPPTPTHTPYPTLAITPTQELKTGIGTSLFRDNFSDADAWVLMRSQQGSVALGKNELTIVVSEERAYFYGLRLQPSFKDFYLEITASPSLCRGKDEYGLLLRVNSEHDYYRFSLSCDGEARLDRIVQGEASSPQPWLTSGAVPPGAPSSSRLGVWAVGKELRFFANDEHLFTVQDPLLPSGGLGVFVRSASNELVSVNFSALEVFAVEE